MNEFILRTSRGSLFHFKTFFFCCRGASCSVLHFSHKDIPSIKYLKKCQLLNQNSAGKFQISQKDRFNFQFFLMYGVLRQPFSSVGIIVPSTEVCFEVVAFVYELVPQTLQNSYLARFVLTCTKWSTFSTVYPGRGFWVNFRKKCGECGEFS